MPDARQPAGPPPASAAPGGPSLEGKRDRSLVRASDLSAWSYCQRAWWLANVQGVAHEDPAQLAYGRTVHREHGRRASRAEWLMKAGRWVLLAALILIVCACIWAFVG